MAYGIGQEIEELTELGVPALTQMQSVNPQLKYALALQEATNIVNAAARERDMAMEQPQPPQVVGQLEQGLAERLMPGAQQMAQQMPPQPMPMQPGVAGVPAPNMMMAGGGIVSFADGGNVEGNNFSRQEFMYGPLLKNLGVGPMYDFGGELNEDFMNRAKKRAAVEKYGPDAAMPVGSNQPIPMLMQKYGSERVMEFLEGQKRFNEIEGNVSPQAREQFEMEKANFMSRFSDMVEDIRQTQSGSLDISEEVLNFDKGGLTSIDPRMLGTPLLPPVTGLLDAAQAQEGLTNIENEESFLSKLKRYPLYSDEEGPFMKQFPEVIQKVRRYLPDQVQNARWFSNEILLPELKAAAENDPTIRERFNRAFREARSKGRETFEFMGGDYHTKYVEEMASGGIVGFANRGLVKAEDIDMDNLLNALMMTESGGDPNAVGNMGELGAYQIRPSTAAQPGLGVAPFTGDLFDPEASRNFSREYLQALLDRYNGDVEAALIAYNAGYQNADNFVAGGRDYEELPQPDTTRPHVRKIMSNANADSANDLIARRTLNQEADAEAEMNLLDAAQDRRDAFFDLLDSGGEKVSPGEEAAMRRRALREEGVPLGAPNRELRMLLPELAESYDAEQQADAEAEMNLLDAAQGRRDAFFDLINSGMESSDTDAALGLLESIMGPTESEENTGEPISANPYGTSKIRPRYQLEPEEPPVQTQETIDGYEQLSRVSPNPLGRNREVYQASTADEDLMGRRGQQTRDWNEEGFAIAQRYADAMSGGTIPVDSPFFNTTNIRRALASDNPALTSSMRQTLAKKINVEEPVDLVEELTASGSDGFRFYDPNTFNNTEEIVEEDQNGNNVIAEIIEQQMESGAKGAPGSDAKFRTQEEIIAAEEGRDGVNTGSGRYEVIGTGDNNSIAQRPMSIQEQYNQLTQPQSGTEAFFDLLQTLGGGAGRSKGYEAAGIMQQAQDRDQLEQIEALALIEAQNRADAIDAQNQTDQSRFIDRYIAANRGGEKTPAQLGVEATQVYLRANNIYAGQTNRIEGYSDMVGQLMDQPTNPLVRAHAEAVRKYGAESDQANTAFEVLLDTAQDVYERAYELPGL